MNSHRWLLMLALATLGACSCSDDDPVAPGDASTLDASSDGGGQGGTGGSGSDGGGTPDAGALADGASGGDGSLGPDDDGGAVSDGAVVLPPPATCGRVGNACSTGNECCSGVCDPTSGSCASSLSRCAAAGEDCAASTDCCNLVCGNDGTCGASACVSDGESCGDDTECCSQRCVSGSCEPLNLACKTAGNACAGSGECCSGLCRNDTCELAASFCIQEGDICARAEDCCTGRCQIADGDSVGVCGPPPTGASFCNDGIEGSLCGDCNECCSRLCAPYGPTGVNVCQPASGCHVTGDFCREDRDCCGAAGTGLPGDGNAQCEKEPGADLGICRNPMSCNPQGNVCHFMNYMCSNSAARANCCGGLGAMGGVCQLDTLGVPRCNGLGDECRMTGDTCASADDCCDDRPCVPDQEGVLRCYEDVCAPETGPCTVNADCCPGATCVRPLGSTVGSCSPSTPPDGGTPDGGTTDGGTTDGGTDGGTPPPPTCAEYGQICGSDGDCCNDVPCSDGICRVPFG